VSIIGSGMFVRSQRMLMLNLRDQAHQAESEARLLAEQAQRLAREALQDLREIIGVLRAGESDPGDSLTRAVTNPAPPSEVPPVPGSGQGLIGLTERAALTGGRLEHGATPAGGFEVRAWLPWKEP
jgi:signal transduction histidine kinase